jgi:hypothetical protein
VKKLALLISCLVLVVLIAVPAQAATQQTIQASIDAGLQWLHNNMTTSGAEGYWSYGNDGTLAATGAAALAFIGEGYLPGDGSIYGDTVQKACNYIFNRAQDDTAYGGTATTRYFNPGIGPPAASWRHRDRSVYTTGICSSVVYELGNALGTGTAIGMGGAAIAGQTYQSFMGGLVEWFTWGQCPDGGWRYYPNQVSSDNSTAQWGALPFLYGRDWGIGTPAAVISGDATTAGLTAWTAQVQNTWSGDWREGGSGYTHQGDYVNMAKTGGMLLEFAVMGLGGMDTRVQDALMYMDSMVSFDHWNQGAHYSGNQWYGGHMNNPYAMWAVFKGLDTWGGLTINDNGTADPNDDFVIGAPGLISGAASPGGITIGQNWATQLSQPGDWYSQYCDNLVNWQNADGSWNGYQYWTGALATGWYINILNATGAPEPQGPIIPEPGTMALFGLGLCGLAVYVRRRRNR